MTSIASTDRGETTIGRENRAWALIGTMSNASTSGQTTGPPAENAYAVDPVGVAHTTPSQPQRDSGRPSTSVTTSSIRSRAAFSTVASFRAQVCATTAPSCWTVTSTVIRSSTTNWRATMRSTVSARPSGSASARNPTWPRFTPSSGAPAGRASSAARRIVPSPPTTMTISAPSAACGPAGTSSTPVQAMSAASGSRTRMFRPALMSRSTTRRALRSESFRPVCATIRAVRLLPLAFIAPIIL